MHVKNPHLFVFNAIQWVLYIKILPPPRQSVEYLLDCIGNVVGCPIRIAEIGDYTSQSLDGLVLELCAKFTPILAVLIQNNSTLVIELTVFKGSLYFKSKFIGELCIQDWSIVILETIVSPLPVVCIRLSRYLNQVLFYAVFFGLVEPLQLMICKFFSH